MTDPKDHPRIGCLFGWIKEGNENPVPKGPRPRRFPMPTPKPTKKEEEAEEAPTPLVVINGPVGSIVVAEGDLTIIETKE